MTVRRGQTDEPTLDHSPAVEAEGARTTFRLGETVSDLLFTSAWCYLAANKDEAVPPGRVTMVTGELDRLLFRLESLAADWPTGVCSLIHVPGDFVSFVQ